MPSGRHPSGCRGALPWLLAAVLVACALPACAARSRGDGAVREAGHPDDRLKDFVARVRALAAEGPPPKNDTAQTVEAWDGLLAAALAELERQPTGARHRAVAQEYHRLGILDAAQSHYSDALARDPRDAAAFDGRARVWRDAGTPGLGLGDAHRAVFLAPRSPEATNTLGTILEGVGDLAAAREQYARAWALDPSATYALINLCHAETMLGKRAALIHCADAVEAAPGSRVAHNNLALAYAASGAFEQARAAFEAVNDRATAAYNLGIVYLAASRVPEAVQSFRDAWRIDPSLTAAADRLRQLGALSTR